MQWRARSIFYVLYLHLCLVVAFPSSTFIANLIPTSSKPHEVRTLDWPKLPYSQSYTPPDHSFKAVKLTFRQYGPRCSEATANTTGLIGALQKEIETQLPLGVMQQAVVATVEGFLARFSLPPKRSMTNTWYCLSALEALRQQYRLYGAREIKADVFDGTTVPVKIGTIVIVKNNERRSNVMASIDRRKHIVGTETRRGKAGRGRKAGSRQRN